MDDIFNLNDYQPVPQRGSLLVAKPTVDDDMFGRSVILVIDHNEDGSMGLVLNHESPLLLSHVLPEVKTPVDVPLHVGGPVDHQVMFILHTLGTEVIPDATPIMDGLYLGGDFEALKRYLEDGGDVVGRVKLVVGYAGWTAGQLMSEIERNDWAVLDAPFDPILMTGSLLDTWQWAVERFGPRYALWHTIPLNPQDN